MNEVTDRSTEISGGTLKTVAVISMLIDHIGAVIIESWMINATTAAQYHALYATDIILRGIGRLAFPLFCFLLVEGFQYTHSRRKYAGNLFLFALISEIPFDLAFSHCLYDGSSQNVFFTLLIGLLTLICIDRLTAHPKNHRIFSLLFYPSTTLACFIVAKRLNTAHGVAAFLPAYTLWIVAIIAEVLIIVFSIKWETARRYTFLMTILPMIPGILSADLMQTDYGGLGVLAIVLMWICHRKHTSSFACGTICLSVGNLYELPSLFDLLLISRYNGKRGRQVKYFFYLFYPVHLLILAEINFMLGFASFSFR